MALITKESKKQSENKSDTFYNYIAKLRAETTVNGSEVKKKFSWYQKVLGLL
ncbi:MAG: hypothetical protein PHE78_04115 [Candidatus Gastranaerophilales bacterium]|jgi:hypothetical protein|nr:hypothetical protein [Candidatus Gastranaerophilales bacterium]